MGAEMINSSRWRFIALQIFLVIMGGLIITRIYIYQVSPQAEDFRVGTEYNYVTQYPARGIIYDRNGNLLAGNVTVYEIGVDQVMVQNQGNAEAIALALSVNIGLDYSTVLTTINGTYDSRYIVLADYVPVESIAKLEKYMDELDNTPGTPATSRLDGIGFKSHFERIYPEKSLASNLIGFVTRDNKGNFGVENTYDNLLAGIPRNVRIPINPTRVEEIPQIEPGTTLVLTIDREIQAAIEEILDKTLVNSGSESGTVIVMDPKTGEILGMTSTPRIDLNNYVDYANIFQGGTPFNRAISQAYEPGSVLKILTLSAAIDSGAIQPSTTFFDTGSIIVGGVAIHNWDGGAWGSQDMTGCTQHSLNVCFAWIATQTNTENFYNYMKRFGLGHITGIDLAYEASGRLKLPGDTDWYPVDLGTNAFGQGLSVTPIQMVMAASAIANQGKMVQPHILKSTIENGVIQNKTVEIVGNPISAQTAKQVNEILVNSLENEASTALVPGYMVAGKTGTAQIPVFGGYDPYQTNASFIGWGPANDPDFMVYIWLEKPQSSTWSSEVAAPVFSEIVKKLVVLMEIPPDQVRAQLAGQ
jgi:cell division protein FtsI/penicillin-binding protein 2